ncbi:MAG: hypothetical protein O3B73_12660 [bacterium]|nr:hypothetical protein [bacterium]
MSLVLETPIVPQVARKGVTPRAVCLGVALVCVEVWIITFSEPIARSSSMNVSHFPVGFFMWFVAAVFGLNPLLKWMRPGFGLSRSELLTLAAMGLIGAHIPGSGLMGFFLGVLAAPYYFASAENQWDALLHPTIPAWLAPSNDTGAMRDFFEGVPSGHIPWSVWIVPLFWWMCLIGALTFVLLCMVVMLRKQWVENERLVYPLISPVSDLIDDVDGEGIWPGMVGNTLFWVGFALGFGMLAWNIGGYFSDLWPKIHFSGSEDLVFIHGFPRMTNRVNIYSIGFGYFANLDVLFSLWFFYLVYWLQNGVFDRIGVKLGPGSGEASEWENVGALFALVGWALWTARYHLRDVFRKAIHPESGVDDSGEMLSYRTAVVGVLLGSAFCLLWLCMVGMEAYVGVIFLLVLFGICLGLAKVVCESGLLYLAWGLRPQTLISSILGTVSMTGGTATTLAFTEGFFFHGKGMFMSSLANGAKMGDLAGVDQRRLARSMGLALLVGIPLCVYLSLGWGYELGAYNFVGFPFRLGRDFAFERAARMLKNPEAPATARLGFLGIGAAGMMVLTLLRYRLSWWPLHPIGFAVGGSGRSTKSTWSIFIAWMCKFLIVKFGGVTLYRRYRPLFTGLLSGYSLGIGVSFAVDLIWFAGQGHWIHLY